METRSATEFTNPTRRSRAAALRWALPATILVGALLTSAYFDAPDRARFFFLATVSSVACAVYVWPLRSFDGSALPHWAIFTILFIGHYLQFYWLLFGEQWRPTWANSVNESIGPETMLEAYSQATAVLSVTACVTILSQWRLFHKRAVYSASGVPVTARRSVCRVAFVTGCTLTAVFAFLMYTYSIGVIGADRVSLPFRLAGVILFARRTAAPALLLTVIALSDGYRSLRGYFRLALLVIGADALIDMVVSTTRAPLVVAGLQLLVLFLVQRTLNARRVQLIALAIVGTIVLFPFVSRLREYRSAGVDVSEAIRNVGSSGGWDADDNESAFALLARFSGTSALLPILRSQARVSLATVVDGVVGDSGGVTEYNTRYIARISRYDRLGVATSLLGWFYLVGGEPFQIFGVALILLLLHLSWDRLGRSRLWVRPVALSVVGVMGFRALAEGDVEALIRSLVPLAVLVILLETFARLVPRSRSSAVERLEV